MTGWRVRICAQLLANSGPRSLRGANLPTIERLCAPGTRRPCMPAEVPRFTRTTELCAVLAVWYVVQVDLGQLCAREPPPNRELSPEPPAPLHCRGAVPPGRHSVAFRSPSRAEFRPPAPVGGRNYRSDLQSGAGRSGWRGPLPARDVAGLGTLDVVHAVLPPVRICRRAVACPSPR